VGYLSGFTDKPPKHEYCTALTPLSKGCDYVGMHDAERRSGDFLTRVHVSYI